MRTLIIVDVFPPEISSASKLVQELAHGLKASGDEVFVATTFPSNYLAEGVKDEKFGKFSDEDGVHIIRVKTPPLKKVNFIIRGLSQLLLPFLVFWKIKQYIKGDLDRVIVYSPPLTLAFAGYWTKKKYGAKFMLGLWDIFPQNAIDLGILKNKLAILFFEVIEEFAYRHADILTFHAEHGKKFLVDKKGIPAQKIVLLPHWVDFSTYEKPQVRDFRKEYGLENKLIFLFGGIMGPAQGLEFLVAAANQSKNVENVVFLLVGDGMEKEKIVELVKRYELRNVLIKNFVSVDDYPDLVNAADVGVVCLSSMNKTPFVPGKFMGYLAAGKPIFAILNKESDGFELVDHSHCGFAVEAGDIDAATKAISALSTLSKSELTKLGSNGKQYAVRNLSLQSAIKKINGYFESFFAK